MTNQITVGNIVHISDVPVLPNITTSISAPSAYEYKLPAIFFSEPTTEDEILTAARELVSNIDTNRWRLGDLMNRLYTPVTGRPKADAATRATYAAEIGVSTSTLEDLQKTAALFPPDCRAIGDNLSWSHYRMAARRTDDLTTAIEWLESASELGWSVNTLGAQLSAMTTTDTKPPKLVETHVMRGTDIASLLGEARFGSYHIGKTVRHDGRIILVLTPEVKE